MAIIIILVQLLCFKCLCCWILFTGRFTEPVKADNAANFSIAIYPRNWKLVTSWFQRWKDSESVIHQISSLINCSLLETAWRYPETNLTFKVVLRNLGLHKHTCRDTITHLTKGGKYGWNVLVGFSRSKPSGNCKDQPRHQRKVVFRAFTTASISHAKTHQGSAASRSFLDK